MPFINTKTTLSLYKDKKNTLTAGLGHIAQSCLNKSESWLMVGFEENCELYFQGKQEGELAYVEVKLFGDAGSASYEKMTAQICGLYEKELGIPSSHVYVSYYPTDHWGWNGGNF